MLLEAQVVMLVMSSPISSECVNQHFASSNKHMSSFALELLCVHAFSGAGGSTDYEESNAFER
jgi:hypothetical protein